MRVSSDCCIVVLSVCSTVIILEQQYAHEEIIVSPWPKFALIKACFKEKSRDTESSFSFCLQLMSWHEDSISISPQLSLDLYYTEDEIYELSYAREPKNCKAPVSDGNRHPKFIHLPVVFALLWSVRWEDKKQCHATASGRFMLPGTKGKHLTIERNLCKNQNIGAKNRSDLKIQ